MDVLSYRKSSKFDSAMQELGDNLRNVLKSYSNNRPQPAIVDCFKNYRGYKWIPCPQRYISKHKEHYQKIIDNTNIGNDTVFLCDRVDLFKIK